MKQDLSDKRKDYSKNYIDFSSIPDNPIKLFSNWFSEVSESKLIDEPYAMNLANLDEDGFPRSRVVLLKEFNSDGFVFYTNYESQKGKALETNPNVCLSFFWDKLEQQVIIRGRAEKIAPIQSDAYFHRRPLDSQVGALVSAQSRVIAFDKNLESEVEKKMSELKGQEVPRPDYWGGYLVRPVEIEFWQGRPSRLHDRLCYRLEGDEWKKVRLAP